MLFYSNAFNLTDWEQEGVDPATGIYIRHIPIASLSANRLLGPTFTLALRFNLFNPIDYGFGTGWELNLTHIDTEQPSDNTQPAIDTLVLADGHRYRLQAGSEEESILKYKRTNTFQIFKDTDTTYTLVYKNGTTETIENGKTTVIKSANGKQVNISWSSDNSFKMTDNDGTVLLSTALSSTAPPGAASNFRNHVVTTARSVLTFYCNQSGIPRLERVKQTTATSSSLLYSIAYGTHNTSFLRIDSWQSFVDYCQRDTVRYLTLPSPDGLGKAVPATSSITRSICSRIGQPAKNRTITYQYGEKNYLGYPDVTIWNDSTDNLEGLPDSFSYQTTETIGDPARPALVTTRTYNKFYLLVHSTPRGPSPLRIKDHAYTYPLTPNAGIDAQPPAFTLYTKDEQTCTTQTGQTSRQTSQSTVREYDDYENLTRVCPPSGMTEWNTYYPAAGEMTEDGTILCPADLYGFVKYLKNQVISSGSNADAVPKKIWQYTYSQMQDTNLVQINEEQYFMQPALPPVTRLTALKKTAYLYDNAGRPTQITSSMARITAPNTPPSYLPTTTCFTYTESSADSTSTIAKETTGYDSSTVKKTESLTQAFITAETLSVIDTNGIVSCFEYDAQGRVTRSTRAKGTENEITTLATFQPMSNRSLTKKTSSQFTEVTVTDDLGNPSEVFWTLPASSTHAGMSYKICSYAYNDLDQVITENEYDYIQQTTSKIIIPPDITQTTKFEWNVYGEPVSRQNPDTSTVSYVYDAHSRNDYPASIAVTYYPGGSTTLSYYNAIDQLCLQETYASHARKKPDTAQEFSYDPFMRESKSTLSGQETFTYEYDAFDRLIVKNGSASGKQSFFYAPHSAAPLVSVIDVDGTVMGEKSHDGLDREISTTINGVKTRYDYSGSSVFSRPALVSITGGRQWAYKYHPVFESITREAIENSVAIPLAIMSFSYAPDSGRLMGEKTVRRAYTYSRTLSYDAFDHLCEDAAAWDSSDLGKYKTTITSTVRGKPVEISVQFNSESTTIKKQYVYDDCGRGKIIRYLSSDTNHTNKILSASYLHRSKSTGNLTQIDNYARTIYNNFRHIKQNRTYNQYNDEKSRSHYLFSHYVFGCNISYTPHRKLKRVSYTFQAQHAYQWDESYTYNDRGALLSWKRNGNVTYRNEYGDTVLKQSFTRDRLGNISTINSELSQGSLLSRYAYENKTNLVKIDNSAISGNSNTPEKIDFKYDSEGNTTSQIYQTANGTSEKHYHYEDSKNISYMADKYNDVDTSAFYYYDATGRKIWTTVSSKTGTLYSANIYVDGHLQIDQHQTNRTDPPFFILYHLVDGETMFITEVNAQGEANVHPCLNGPHGTPVVEGHQYVTYGIATTETRVFYRYYNFHIRGQNAYGLTFDLGASEYDANRSADLPEE